MLEQIVVQRPQRREVGTVIGAVVQAREKFGAGLCLFGVAFGHVNELQERIEGISKKMLTQTLRKLEANGLVERRVLCTAPPGAEYRLTPLGRTLLEPVRSLSRWAEEHADDLLEAQDRAAAAAGP